MSEESYTSAEEIMLVKDKDGLLVPKITIGDTYYWVEGGEGKDTKVLEHTFQAEMPGDRVIKEQRSDTVFTDFYPTPALAMVEYARLLEENEKRTTKS